jgi:hypothetical protein
MGFYNKKVLKVFSFPPIQWSFLANYYLYVFPSNSLELPAGIEPAISWLWATRYTTIPGGSPYTKVFRTQNCMHVKCKNSTVATFLIYKTIFHYLRPKFYKKIEKNKHKAKHIVQWIFKQEITSAFYSEAYRQKTFKIHYCPVYSFINRIWNRMGIFVLFTW